MNSSGPKKPAVDGYWPPTLALVCVLKKLNASNSLLGGKVAMEKKQQTFIHEKTENLCKKHSLSHNIGAIEAILQRRYDKHAVNGTYKES